MRPFVLCCTDFFPVGTTKTAAAPGTAGVVQPVVVTPPKPKAHTVTPGPIVHLYKENDGTHSFSSLQY